MQLTSDFLTSQFFDVEEREEEQASCRQSEYGTKASGLGGSLIIQISTGGPDNLLSGPPVIGSHPGHLNKFALEDSRAS